jgi:hypothetical protein
MRKRGYRLRLALEPRERVRIARDRDRQDLDRNLALELRVPRPIGLPHPAGADRADDLVGAKSGTGCQRHGGRNYRPLTALPRRNRRGSARWAKFEDPRDAVARRKRALAWRSEPADSVRSELDKPKRAVGTRRDPVRTGASQKNVFRDDATVSENVSKPTASYRLLGVRAGSAEIAKPLKSEPDAAVRGGQCGAGNGVRTRDIHLGKVISCLRLQPPSGGRSSDRQCDIQCDTSGCKAGHTRAKPERSESRKRRARLHGVARGIREVGAKGGTRTLLSRESEVFSYNRQQRQPTKPGLSWLAVVRPCKGEGHKRGTIPTGSAAGAICPPRRSSRLPRRSLRWLRRGESRHKHVTTRSREVRSRSSGTLNRLT